MFIMTKINNVLKRVLASALAVVLTGRRGLLAVFLCASLLSLGSCDEEATLLGFQEHPTDLSVLSQNELDKHARVVKDSITEDPALIASLRQQDIELALAKPDLVRVDGQTQVWQYRTQSCVLDIYWRGKDVTSKSASHYEFRARQNGDMQNQDEAAPWHCVQSIIQKRDI